MGGTYPLIVIVSFFVPLIFAIAGLGSAVALIPILVLLGIPFDYARSVGLFVNGVTTISITVKNVQSGDFKPKIALPIVIFSIPFAVFGAYTSFMIPRKVVGLVFTFFSVLCGNNDFKPSEKIQGEGRNSVSSFSRDRSFIRLHLRTARCGWRRYNTASTDRIRTRSEDSCNCYAFKRTLLILYELSYLYETRWSRLGSRPNLIDPSIHRRIRCGIHSKKDKNKNFEKNFGSRIGFSGNKIRFEVLLIDLDAVNPLHVFNAYLMYEVFVESVFQQLFNLPRNGLRP